jgi:uncharacterized protein (TIGR04255 family)
MLMNVSDTTPTESFANAPLIEIDVELHWAVPSTPDAESDDEVIADEVIAEKPFFRALGKRLSEIGFSQVERLYPAGFEVSPHTVTRRFNNPADESSAIAYQAGAAAFTVNAIPPYTSWSEFRPDVERGLTALFESFPESERPKVITRIDLSYIDAFTDEHLDGKSRLDFFNNSLGFDVGIPAAIANLIEGGEPSSPFVQFDGKTADGKYTAVKTGFATVSNTPAVVLDMLISHRDEVHAEVTNVLSVLDTSHQLIHDTFMKLTNSFVDVLRKVEA